MSIRGAGLRVPHVSVGEEDKIITPFGPMIYQTFLSDDEVKTLLEEGDKLNIENNDYAYSLAGNMKHGRSYQYTQEFTDSFSPVVLEKAGKFIDSVADIWEIGLPQVHNLSLYDLWINYQKPNDFNPFHTHSHFLSFVIYCDVSEKIFEEQADSNDPVAGYISFHYGEKISPLCKTGFSFRPENNLMFLFPARLQHVVYPFYSGERRVSVAGNIVCDYSL